MKRNLLFFLVAVLVSAQVCSQTRLDTIDVSDQATTYVLFPQPVKVIDLGSKHFVGKVEGKAVFLKAVNMPPPFRKQATSLYVGYGEESFLAVIRYKESLSTFFYDYGKGASRGKEAAREKEDKSEEAEAPPIKSPEILANTEVNRYEAVRLKLEGMAENAPNTALLSEANGIKLQLLNVYNDKEYTYLKFNVENQSTAIYRVDYVSFTYKEPVKKRKRNSLSPQIREMKVVSALVPAAVEGKTTGMFLYAIPLFSTNEKSHLEIVIRETQGSRQVFLQVPAPQISSAPFL